MTQKLLSRVRALLERGERISKDDCRDLFAVRDLVALAKLARIPRERRFGRQSFFRALESVPFSALATTDDANGPLAVRCVLREGEGLATWVERLAEIQRSARPATAFLSAGFLTRLAGREGVPVGTVITALRDAGPIFVTGEEAELFDGAFRAVHSRDVISSEEWLAAHRAAHILGVGSGASMLYTVEDHPEAYAEHLVAIRDLQDGTGGFLQFVPLAVHNRDVSEFYLAAPTAAQTLRTTAIARIVLDNVPHIAVAPALITAEVAYVALSYGADSIDPTVSVSDLHSQEGSGTSSPSLSVLGDGAAVVTPGVALGLVRDRIAEARWTPVAVDATYGEIGMDEVDSFTR